MPDMNCEIIQLHCRLMVSEMLLWIEGPALPRL